MVFSRGLTGLPAIFEYCQVCHWHILCHFITILLSWFGCPFSCVAFVLLLQLLKEKREQKHKHRFWFISSNSSCLIFRMLQKRTGHKSCQWPNHSIILNQTTYQPHDFIDIHRYLFLRYLLHRYSSEYRYAHIHRCQVFTNPQKTHPPTRQLTLQQSSIGRWTAVGK